MIRALGMPHAGNAGSSKGVSSCMQSSPDTATGGLRGALPLATDVGPADATTLARSEKRISRRARGGVAGALAAVLISLGVVGVASPASAHDVIINSSVVQGSVWARSTWDTARWYSNGAWCSGDHVDMVVRSNGSYYYSTKHYGWYRPQTRKVYSALAVSGYRTVYVCNYG